MFLCDRAVTLQSGQLCCAVPNCTPACYSTNSLPGTPMECQAICGNAHDVRNPSPWSLSTVTVIQRKVDLHDSHRSSRTVGPRTVRSTRNIPRGFTKKKTRNVWSIIIGETTFLRHSLPRDLPDKKKLLPESAGELYRPNDRRLSAKLVPTFADTECHVVRMTDPQGRILGFLDQGSARLQIIIFLQNRYLRFAPNPPT
jgi:hypothetical protein